MPFSSGPISFRLSNSLSAIADRSFLTQLHPFSAEIAQNAFEATVTAGPSHPALGHLILLVFEAVLEVVCVSLPGYIIARRGLFDAEMQKFVANLNVMLFTPCLIFTKLASQLTADKLAELAVIPVIFLVQTLVSYLCSVGVAKAFRFKNRPRNFVIAMGVFGNSNSLPISLVISLSQTLAGLHWDKIPGDNDDEVAARGILYLLIFQQLGQLLRWSWGYHVLLAPPEAFEGEEQRKSQAEQGQVPYSDEPAGENEETRNLILYRDEEEEEDENGQQSASGSHGSNEGSDETDVRGAEASKSRNSSEFDSGDQTPITGRQYTSSIVSKSSVDGQTAPKKPSTILPTPANGNLLPSDLPRDGTIESNPRNTEDLEESTGFKKLLNRVKSGISRQGARLGNQIKSASAKAVRTLPEFIQTALSWFYRIAVRFLGGVWEFMNPPLWAMLTAIVVASIPSVQRIFFTPGSFLENSATRAISQSGGVAVPLILVVLGANLARNTLPNDPHHTIENDKEDRNLLIASIVSRMLLPTIVMAPMLALAAKYIPVSILDDPIFVIVCFLLTGAPSALQLAQICQINGVYEKAMSKLLFQSYVIWILPSTLVLVMCALEVVQWADD